MKRLMRIRELLMLVGLELTAMERESSSSLRDHSPRPENRRRRLNISKDREKFVVIQGGKKGDDAT